MAQEPRGKQFQEDQADFIDSKLITVEQEFAEYQRQIEGLQQQLAAARTALQMNAPTIVRLQEQLETAKREHAKQFADEREKVRQAEWERDVALRQGNEALNQLAAERLRANQKEGAFFVASKANQQLRKQLAAERGGALPYSELEALYRAALKREKVAWCEVHIPDEPVNICPACECVHLSQQLAAERELTKEARQQRDWLIKECERIGVTVNVQIGAPITEAYRLVNEQLADAVEALKRIRKISEDDDWSITGLRDYVQSEIDAALEAAKSPTKQVAKLGEPTSPKSATKATGK